MPDHFSSERVVIAKVQKGGAGKDAQAGEKKAGQALPCRYFFPEKKTMPVQIISMARETAICFLVEISRKARIQQAAKLVRVRSATYSRR